MKLMQTGMAFLMIGVMAACATTPPVEDSAPELAIPAVVAAAADPSQDLTTARLRAEDNCYWYLYAGPVETTLLPLKTVDGRPICAA